MKKLILLLISIVTFNITNSLYSQPIVIIHAFGGYSLPVADLRGDVLDSISHFRTKNGFNIGADFKVGVGKTRNVRLTLSLVYNSFINSSEIDAFVGTEKVKLNNLELGIGGEYALIPKSFVSPFIGAEFTGNFFSGSIDFDNPDSTHPAASLRSASRFGLNIGAGLDLMLVKSIGVSVGGVVGAKYHMSNLFGRKNESSASASSNYDLNDESKNISYVSFYAGVAISIGGK